MSDMHVIGQIEKKLGLTLKKISMAEVEKADHYHEKAYAIDEDNNVTGLWLEGDSNSLISEISELTQLSALNLRNSFFEKIHFLHKLAPSRRTALSSTG